MQLPLSLQAEIDQLFQNTSQSMIKKATQELTFDYKQGRSSPFSDEAKRLAYLGARMPATYAAVYKVLSQLPFPIHDLLDLGAGPGTASWAAAEIFPDLRSVILVEISPEAIQLGKTLSQNHPVLSKANWIQGTLPSSISKTECAVLSYVLNELPDPLQVVKQVWEKAETIVLVEPGTPRGFERIKAARQMLIEAKSNLIGPCTHSFRCPMEKGDWCHFAARVERSRLHRLLKGGSLGYEDEKFSYLIASKHRGQKFEGRIIRRPEKGSGFVKLTLCTGSIEEKTVTRSQKNSYKLAKEAEWGDGWNLQM